MAFSDSVNYRVITASIRYARAHACVCVHIYVSMCELYKSVVEGIAINFPKLHQFGRESLKVVRALGCCANKKSREQTNGHPCPQRHLTYISINRETNSTCYNNSCRHEGGGGKKDPPRHIYTYVLRYSKEVTEKTKKKGRK